MRPASGTNEAEARAWQRCNWRVGDAGSKLERIERKRHAQFVRGVLTAAETCMMP